MGLRLYPPGTRKGNRYYVVRGRIDGKQYEVSTESTDPKTARRFAAEFEARARAGRGPCLGPGAPFSQIADAYLATRDPGRNDRRYVARLKKHFGRRRIDSIRQSDIDMAAVNLYPGAKATTRNRQVHTPMAAIMHFAADDELTPYRVVRKMRAAQPETRRAKRADMDRLVEATTGDRRLLLMILRDQGFRISETLGITWDHNIDLQDGLFDFWIPKRQRWKRVVMHPAVFEALAAINETNRRGALFPWRTRSGVYRWLRPLTKDLGITFTPHMARHAFASDLNDLNATGQDILEASSWTSDKSIARYTEVDLSRARQVIARLPRGKTGGQVK